MSHTLHLEVYWHKSVLLNGWGNSYRYERSNDCTDRFYRRVSGYDQGEQSVWVIVVDCESVSVMFCFEWKSDEFKVIIDLSIELVCPPVDTSRWSVTKDVTVTAMDHITVRGKGQGLLGWKKFIFDFWIHRVNVCWLFTLFILGYGIYVDYPPYFGFGKVKDGFGSDPE